MREISIKRGDLFYLNFGNTTGSEQNGVRPVVVISNEMANRFSPAILVSPITSKFSKKELPTHVKLNYRLCGLKKESQVLLEQIYTVDKSRLGTYIGSCDIETMDKIDKAAEISIAVGGYKSKEIEIVKNKVKYIEDLDIFIRRWIRKTGSTNRIEEEINEREIRIKELKNYSERRGINYKEYYRCGETLLNLVEMVG